MEKRHTKGDRIFESVLDMVIKRMKKKTCIYSHPLHGKIFSISKVAKSGVYGRKDGGKC